ncbi:MAG: relaxase, partial [Flavobacterium sp.]
MVAKITTPSTIIRALNYNEKKVQKGVATCLHADNFLKDAGAMNFYEKLGRFKHLIELNTRAKTNSLHISLNFHPWEALNREKLVQIAAVYMEKIGFGAQPYLVYEHLDAGHPHLHIVTTSIREDGSRIVTQNIGKNQSQVARKEIEEAFGLMQASSPASQSLKAPEEDIVQKIKY